MPDGPSTAALSPPARSPVVFRSARCAGVSCQSPFSAGRRLAVRSRRHGTRLSYSRCPRACTGCSHLQMRRACVAPSRSPGLEPGECESPQLHATLRDLEAKVVVAQLNVLSDERLIKRRIVGRHTAYKLSKDGECVARSCHMILAQLGFRSTALSEIPTDPAQVKQLPRQPAPAVAAPDLVEAATLLNHAANPVRLRLLLSLMEKGRDCDQLARELGDITAARASNHLGVLRSGKLVTCHRNGKRIRYLLSMNGLSLVQVVRATCSALTIRRGTLSLRPEPMRSGEADGVDPASPEGLARLLKAFASPLRLRVLNLLVNTGEVCACHFPDALELPKSLIFFSLSHPLRLGLILQRQEGEWTIFRPARAASNLFRSLVGCFGLRLSETQTFENDRQKLAQLPRCAGRSPARRQDTSPARSDRGPRSSRGKTASRTA